MMRLFDNYTCKGKLLTSECFSQQLAEYAQKGIEDIEAYKKELIISNADNALKTDIPVLKASEYMQFHYTGNRTDFQKPYYLRRSMLIDLVFGELFENKGRFINKIVDIAWLILEESTWVIPAHSRSGEPLLYERDDVSYVDLFSASTAAVLTLVYVSIKDEIDKKDKQICARVIQEIERRILLPYEKYAQKWWYIGCIEGHKINNWNPWIHSNILFAASVFVQDIDRLEKICDSMLTYTDNWLDTYWPDGGCDEGPSYWAAAGASYFDFLDLLYRMSQGNINVFGDRLVYNIGDYIRKMHIFDRFFVNFADSGPKPGNLDAHLIYRYGKMTDNKVLMDFACMFDIPVKISNHHPQRSLFNLIEEKDCQTTSSYIAPCKEIMEDTQVFIFRNKMHFLAVKGGHNREAHNHNDVGHFVIYEQDKPIIIDAGSDTYSKKTFSEERYSLWNMQSSYHNLPDISGFAQLPGSAYKAKDVKFEDKDKTVSMQLREAYPKEAGIISFMRKIEIKEDAIVILDDISLDKEGYIEGHLMLLYEPDIDKDVVYVSNTKVEIKSTQTLEYEKISVLNATGLNTGIPERGEMAKAWDTDFMYRVKAGVTTDKICMKYVISRRD